ncbi:MAG: hypothetical protein B6229_08210, partial [Spirochaetaceae bacterium 4572_7]
MAEKYEIIQILEIFDADPEFTTALAVNGDSLSQVEREDMAELLIDNKTYISNNSSKDLREENFLYSSLNGAIGGILTDALYLQILNTYKYSAVKIFFRQNYHKFIPEYDLYELEGKSTDTKKQLYIQAFMREFDRFSLIIDYMYNTVDINKIPQEYINYLGQLIGYQREDYLLIQDATFRELIKNIIEIYKIKGSNYSFELFFNFLGFDIEIQEFWFDKRYGDTGIASNTYTGSVNKKSYSFYLTPVKPTDSIPSDMYAPYPVNENQITDARNISMFTHYTDWFAIGDSRGFSYKQLIGDTAGYTGDTFTWFKTNIIQYALTSLGSDQDPELDAADLETIEYYAKFLTPIYVKRQISLAAAPYEENATSSLFFRDSTRADPIYRTQTLYTLKYDIQSIDKMVGDSGDTPGDATWDPRAFVVVSDPLAELFTWVHRSDHIQIDNSGDSNDGNYYVYGDTDGDTIALYNAGLLQTTVILKGPMPGEDQSSPAGTFRIGAPDSMMHLYQGVMPSRYYWGDTNPVSYKWDNAIGDTLGDSYYGDSWMFKGHGDTLSYSGTAGSRIISFGQFHKFFTGQYLTLRTGGDSLITDLIRNTGDTFVELNNVLVAGDTGGSAYLHNFPVRGHFLSGQHEDTYNAIYDRTNSNSTYKVLETANPTWNSEQIITEINRLNQTRILFNYETKQYKVRNRDLFIPIDTVRNIPGDSTWSAGDTFTVGDTYVVFLGYGDSAGDTLFLIRPGDSKGYLKLHKVTGGVGDTPGDSYRSGDSYYRSSGDSVHGYINNSFVMISNNVHQITNVGDTFIEIVPPYEGGQTGSVQKIFSWYKYLNTNTAGDSVGDSIYYNATGFMNPMYHHTFDFAETGPLTLGMNAPMETESVGRPIEIQDSFERDRDKYWVIAYTAFAGDSRRFRPGDTLTGDSSGASAWIVSDNGDSTLNTIYTDTNFYVSEKIISGNGDSATFSSITEYTDQRGLITKINANGGVIHVYEPGGDSGDSVTHFSEFEYLT